MISHEKFLELIKKEKEEYEIKKKEFYDNPLHWDNNKRKRKGLPVFRGKVNKYRCKKYPYFRPTQEIFFILEDIIDEKKKKTINEHFINEFVDIKNFEIGDKAFESRINSTYESSV